MLCYFAVDPRKKRRKEDTKKQCMIVQQSPQRRDRGLRRQIKGWLIKGGGWVSKYDCNTSDQLKNAYKYNAIKMYNIMGIKIISDMLAETVARSSVYFH